MMGRAVEGCIHLMRIVPTPVQTPDVGVTHSAHHLEQTRILAKEFTADIPAIVGLEALIFAVQGLHHDALQDAILVARQQRIPVRAPDQFQNIPASTTKVPFELLDDLAVAAHRAI